jgi:hypothetical protein
MASIIDCNQSASFLHIIINGNLINLLLSISHVLKQHIRLPKQCSALYQVNRPAFLWANSTFFILGAGYHDDGKLIMAIPAQLPVQIQLFFEHFSIALLHRGWYRI